MPKLVHCSQLSVHSRARKLAARGFTLVEILVAVAVLGLAVAVAVPNLRNFSNKQAIADEASKMIQILRQAQANAQSGVKCPSADSDQWWVSINQPGQNPRVYYLGCKSSGVPVQTVKTIKLPSSIVDSYYCPTADPASSPQAISLLAQVVFNSSTFGYSGFTFPTQCTSGGPLIAKIEDTKTSQITYVVLTPGGVIYETNSPP